MHTISSTDPVKEIEHTIQFESKEEKDDFIKSENIFCRSAMIAVHNAKEKHERLKYKKQLFNRRMDFLARQGFVKKSGNNWVKEIISQDDPDDDFFGT